MVYQLQTGPNSDLVVLCRDLPEHGLTVGDVGVITSWSSGSATVVFKSGSGRQLARVKLSPEDVRGLAEGDILHVRGLAAARNPDAPAPNLDAATVRKIRTKIGGLRRTKRFVRWGEDRKEADKLRDILVLLEPDPITGAEIEPLAGAMLAADFLETDRVTFERSDDSNGIIQDVYWLDAVAAFMRFAVKCTDHDALATRVLALQEDDAWGIRMELVRRASEFLPEGHLRMMMERCAERADETQGLASEDSTDWRHEGWLQRVGLLARQLRDAETFARVRRSERRASAAAEFDIALVYVENGRHEEALTTLANLQGTSGRSWISKDPSESHVDELLLVIYAALGDADKRAEVAWRYFRDHRTTKRLGVLLEVVGPGERERVLDEEQASIMASAGESLSDAQFLIDVGRTAAAEAYLVSRHEQIEGRYYPQLRKLGKAFEADDYPLGASVVYRALITTVLDEGRAKAYRFAASDLRKLDRLADAIGTWESVPTHEAFKAGLLERHGRKRRFWMQYE